MKKPTRVNRVPGATAKASDLQAEVNAMFACLTPDNRARAISYLESLKAQQQSPRPSVCFPQ